MTKSTTTPKTWTKPELVRVGTIKDVAGPVNTGAQGGKS